MSFQQRPKQKQQGKTRHTTGWNTAQRRHAVQIGSVHAHAALQGPVESALARLTSDDDAGWTTATVQQVLNLDTGQSVHNLHKAIPPRIRQLHPGRPGRGGKGGGALWDPRSVLEEKQVRRQELEALVQGLGGRVTWEPLL